MAEETRETALNDDALSKAHDEAVMGTEESQSQEAVLETENAVAEIPEQTEHEVRSELGRKASKKLNQRLDSIESKFDQLMNQLSSFSTNKTDGQQESKVSDDDYVTLGQARKIWEEEKRVDSEKQKAYENTYLEAIDELADEEGLTESDIKEVSKLLSTTFKTSTTNFKMPIADAKINFTNAMRAYEKSKGKKSVPLNGSKPIGTGSVNSQMVDKAVTPPKLDKEAQDFVSYLARSGSKLSEGKELGRILK